MTVNHRVTIRVRVIRRESSSLTWPRMVNCEIEFHPVKCTKIT